MLEQIVQASTHEALSALGLLQQPASQTFIIDCAKMLAETFSADKKLIIAGNGGSLCDAAHFAEELTGRFRQERRALPAIALNDPGHITCTANDMGFDRIFSRGIEAYGRPNDVFIGLTTSGKSPNMTRAFALAQERNLKTIAFLGKGGGDLAGVADLELCIDGFGTSDRIQEVHMTAIHIIIEVLESFLFPELSISPAILSAAR